MVGVVGVDVGFIRQSAQEVGNLLQMANEMRLSEVSNLLSLQAQTAEEVQNVQAMEAEAQAYSGLGAEVNFIA